MMNYMYYNHNFFPGFGFLSIVFRVAWWLLLVWIFMSIIRHFTNLDNHSPDKPSTDEALNILRQRYAKGEISKKEFDSMKKDLG